VETMWKGRTDGHVAVIHFRDMHLFKFLMKSDTNNLVRYGS